ncbi:MAG: lysophospholipid acyltransferase family protein [Patescibacteria group bacterium]
MKKTFSIFSRLFLVPVLKNFLIDRVEGEENIPNFGNFIIASNHRNPFLDHFFIGYPFKDRLESMHFIGKMEKFYHPIIFGPLYFFAETITVNRKSKDRRKVLEKALDLLRKGDIIVIYPEGGSNKDKVLRRGKTGVAELAIKTRLPIVPVGISVNPRNKKIIVRIGKPLNYSQDFVNSLSNDKVLRGLTDRTMKAISQLCDKEYSY